MATTTTTPEQVAEQYAVAEAAAARHRAKLNAIADAENTARHQAQLEHFTDAAGPRAARYREERDAAKQQLDSLAYAEQFDMNAVAAAFLDWKTLDKRAGSLRNHAARLHHFQPRRNHLGVELPPIVGCDELYARTTLVDYLNEVFETRLKQARSEHAAELESEASQKVTAAVEHAARTAAAAGSD
jgi:hypothetical protein